MGVLPVEGKRKDVRSVEDWNGHDTEDVMVNEEPEDVWEHEGEDGQEDEDEDMKKEKLEDDREHEGENGQEDEDEDMEDVKNGQKRISGGGFAGRGKLVVIAVVVILIMASFGAVLYFSLGGDEDDEKQSVDAIDPYDGLGSDTPSSNNLNAVISEVNPSEEWFEVYIDAGSGSDDAAPWYFTTFDERLILMPTVTGLDGTVHVTIYTGNGTDDLDGSDGFAEVYLLLGGDVLEDAGDEIGLFDVNEDIIDFVGWGTGNGDTPREDWNITAYPSPPGEGSSISLIGEDNGVNSEWMATIPSKGDFPLIEIDLSEDGFNESIQVRSGRTRDQAVNTNGTWNRQFVIKARGVIKRGGPLKKKDLDDTLEYASHTYRTLRKMGYDVPAVTGHKEDGKPFVRIVVTKNGDYEGYYDADNRTVHVDLGDNKYASKQTVEHEIFHAFQFKQRDDGSRAMNPNREQGFDEGMAEFIGRYSTITNFKDLTWLELEEELKKAGSMNIFDITTDLEKDVFGDWPGSGDLSDHYEVNYLFIKFLMDKYGIDIIKKIFDSTKNYGNQAKEEGDVTGTDAIAAATGKKFADLLLEFTVWRVDKTKFSQYKESEEWPGYDVNSKEKFTGKTLEYEESIDDLVTRVNEFIMDGRDGLITVKPDKNITLGITIIKEKADGKKEYTQMKLGPGNPGGVYIPQGYKKVTVLKTSLAKTELGGSFKIKVQPGPVITPMGPPDNDHIMWDPPYGMPEIPITWEGENLTDNTTVRIELDNTSTFSDPYLEEIMWDPFEPFLIPRDIQNGTWWWRIRWHEDLVNHSGPWSAPWNFTVWKGYSRPEIIWDPIPVRYENLTGSLGLLIPETRVRVIPTSAPPGMDLEDGVPQVRLSGQVGSTVLEPGPDDWIEIGENMEEGYDTIEWRVGFPSFSDVPWFRDDIMWDPEPPELIPFPPLLEPRQRENRTVHIGVNDTFPVESFFDVFYGLDLPGSEKKQYTEAPVKNGTEDGLIIYDLLLNFSQLDEGAWTFNITVRDELGRSSEPLLLDFEVDRTAPGFVIETDPAGTPPYLNGPFDINIWSEDETARSVMVMIDDIDGGHTPVDVVEPPEPWTHAREWVATHDLIGNPIPEGPITIRVTLWDDLGNEVTDSLDAWIDTLPPEVLMIYPDNPSWEVGSDNPVRVDVLEDQTDMTTITQVRAVLRCMENLTEAVNITLSWDELSLFAGIMTVPIWASVSVPWMVEVYAWDMAGNVGSTNKMMELYST